MIISRRRLGTAVVAASSLLAIATGVVGASAATAPAPAPGGSAPTDTNFVPPKVGAISVDIGPTIIGGKVMDPGLHITLPEVSAQLPGTVETAPVAADGHKGASRTVG
jgi:hypothetical protein